MSAIDPQITAMPPGQALPRDNGELVFASPWEARIFALAVALHQGGHYPWRDFSAHLAQKIATAEQQAADSTYYQRWLQALEQLLLDRALITPAELNARAAVLATADDHSHG